jgi:hypothetical protein
VDYVSEEARLAGESAAAFIKDSGSSPASRVPVEYSGGIRYTIPCSVDPQHVGKWLKFRFRVGDVMTNRKVVLYLDDRAVITKKRRVMAPGEREELVLTKKALDEHAGFRSLAIRVEEDV